MKGELEKENLPEKAYNYGYDLDDVLRFWGGQMDHT